MSGETRTYTKKARAEAEEATRLRITESAVALHGSIGPARTSISAIAEHAGVRRSTVYRHFADEAAIFEACTSHWNAQNPPPDISGMLATQDPSERVRSVLEAMYAWYRQTEAMLGNVLRDESVSPLAQKHLQPYHDFLAFLREPLLTGRGLRGRARRRTEAAIGHALSFDTWKSLARDEGLTDDEAAALMTSLVDAAR
jgi:AcrR family transcriptional regulator